MTDKQKIEYTLWGYIARHAEGSSKHAIQQERNQFDTVGENKAVIRLIAPYVQQGRVFYIMRITDPEGSHIHVIPEQVYTLLKEYHGK